MNTIADASGFTRWHHGEWRRQTRGLPTHLYRHVVSRVPGFVKPEAFCLEDVGHRKLRRGQSFWFEEPWVSSVWGCGPHHFGSSRGRAAS
jgi:hypothetical protein